MSSFRRAAAALAVVLPLALTSLGMAGGDSFMPAQRHLVAPLATPDAFAVQKQVMLPAQKLGFSPIQQPAPFAVPSYSLQKQVVAMPVPQVGCEPKITYLHHGCQKKRACCCCELPYQVVLTVVDPEFCGRALQIPVTVPPECVNVPWQKDRPGLFCRGVSIFEWPCGYRVKVVLLHKGDVVVHTFGKRVQPTAVPVAYPIESYPAEQSFYSPAPTPALPPEADGPELVPPGGQAF